MLCMARPYFHIGALLLTVNTSGSHGLLILKMITCSEQNRGFALKDYLLTSTSVLCSILCIYLATHEPTRKYIIML